VDKPKIDLSRLGYSPDDFPKMTGGAISRTRVFEGLRTGKLKGKKAGQRTIITPEEAKKYIDSLPDWKPNTEPDAA
jgi:hypothetical protein